MASTYELIETTTLSSSASSVTFSSITQDYRDLVLVCDLKVSGSIVFPGITLNSDTGANYSYVRANGDDNNASSSAFSSQNAPIQGIMGISAGEQGVIIFQLMDYSATDKHKSLLARGSNADSGTSMWAARWANTDAITSVEISGNNPYDAGSSFSLYGIAS